MIAGIVLVATLGADARLGLDNRLQAPVLRLALLGQESPSARDWPMEPEQASSASAQRHKSKLSLIPSIVLLSAGTAVLTVGVLGAAIGGASPCGPGGDNEILGCNAGTVLSFAAVGVFGGILFLIGAVWLIVDVVLNAQRADIEPAGPASDSPRASRREGPGLLLTRF